MKPCCPLLVSQHDHHQNKYSVTCSLAFPWFCLHFHYLSVDVLTYTHRIFTVKVEGAGGNTRPCIAPLTKPRETWMEENIRHVRWQILRAGTRKNSFVYSYKSFSSGIFWENHTGTFLRDASTRCKCCGTSLLCFLPVTYAHQQKTINNQHTNHLTWERKDYFSYAIDIQGRKSCWQAVEKESCLTAALDFDWPFWCYYLKHLEKKTKEDLSLSLSAVH